MNKKRGNISQSKSCRFTVGEGKAQMSHQTAEVPKSGKSASLWNIQEQMAMPVVSDGLRAFEPRVCSGYVQLHTKASDAALTQFCLHAGLISMGAPVTSFYLWPLAAPLQKHQ